MRQPLRSTNIITYGLLPGASLTSFLLADSLSPRHGAAAPPSVNGNVMDLDCVIRDFHGSHADFNSKSPTGNGHCAGNVALTLSSNDCPTFIGGGYKVDKQW